MCIRDSIKPATLDLTYSGEKLVGKTVDFKTDDSEKGTITLNDIIPGEKTTPIQIDLCEQGDSYTFSGKNITMKGATVTYSGTLTPKDVYKRQAIDHSALRTYT